MTREKITVDDVLALMPIVADRRWGIAFNGPIRDHEGYCPLCALASEFGINPDDTRGSVIDTDWPDWITEEVRGSIMAAADFRGSRYRADLQRALGML